MSKDTHTENSEKRPLLAGVLGLYFLILVSLYLGTYQLVKILTYQKENKTDANSPQVLVSAITTASTSTVSAEMAATQRNMLKITKLKIEAPIVELGLDKDNEIEVPTEDSEVGWYKFGPKPGQVGPAVLVGHKDSIKGSAIFANLNKLQIGDQINLSFDKIDSTFEVTDKQTYSQDSFPTEAVYGAVKFAALRLITCAGFYDRSVQRYSDNLIVYAKRIH